MGHTLYEGAPARLDVKFEYIGPDSPADENENASLRSNFEQADSEIREFEVVRAPALFCECGEGLIYQDAVVEHIQNFSAEPRDRQQT